VLWVAYATHRTLKPVTQYHSKHVEQFPDKINLCNVASFWIYIYTCYFMVKVITLLSVHLPVLLTLVLIYVTGLVIYVGLPHWKLLF